MCYFVSILHLQWSLPYFFRYKIGLMCSQVYRMWLIQWQSSVMPLIHLISKKLYAICIVPWMWRSVTVTEDLSKWGKFSWCMLKCSSHTSNVCLISSVKLKVPLLVLHKVWDCMHHPILKLEYNNQLLQIINLGGRNFMQKQKQKKIQPVVSTAVLLGVQSFFDVFLRCRVSVPQSLEPMYSLHLCVLKDQRGEC